MTQFSSVPASQSAQEVAPTYQFAILDPRPIPAAQEANAKVLGATTLGIEVTIPALANQCGLGNLDPQHSGQNADMAAIELALTAEIPPEGSMMVTVRADLDALGSMAILNLRKQGIDLTNAAGRIQQIATADKFARGGYPGPQPLPSADKPWNEGTASAEGSKPLAAIAAAISDFKVPVAERVAFMEEWLLDGTEPTGYRERVEKERQDMIQALASGVIVASTTPDGRIAIVTSEHRAATSVGYAMAPVVVALNPAFRFQGGELHAKFTICQFAGGFVDLKSALTDLAAFEPGWGGSPTIGGSPQGVNSTLTTDQVVEIVERHLLPAQ